VYKRQDVAPRDELRPLTKNGVDEVHSICKQFVDIKKLNVIYASPYLRAQQTADIASAYVGAGKSHQRCDVITPASAPAAALDFLYERHKDDSDIRILLVSHMPFVAGLVGGLSNANDDLIAMPTASLAYLSGDVLAKDCCDLHWIKRP